MTYPVHTAWDLIGYDGDASLRIVGGTALYETVMFDESSARGDRPRLAKVVADERGLRQVNRWVDPDTLVELIGNCPGHDDDEDCEDDPQNPCENCRSYGGAS